MFPVVGALVGAAQVLVLWVCRRAMPPTLTATMVVLAGIALTGALHLDGLADMADPYARPDAGLGRALTDHVRDRDVWASTALTLTVTAGLARGSGIASLALALALTVGVGFVCWRRIGGVTGDALGANAVLCEAMILMAAVAQS